MAGRGTSRDTSEGEKLELRYRVLGEVKRVGKIMARPTDSIEYVERLVLDALRAGGTRKVKLFLAKQADGTRGPKTRALAQAPNLSATAMYGGEPLEPGDQLKTHFQELGSRELHILVQEIERESFPREAGGNKLEQEVLLQCLLLDEAKFVTVPVVIKKASIVQVLQGLLKELLYAGDRDILPSMLNLHLAVDDNGGCLFSSAPEISWFQRGVKAPMDRWRRKKMDPESTIGDIIPSVVALPYQIHVLVEPPQDFFVGRDDAYDQFTKPYHATATLLKDSSEVNQLVELVKTVSQKKLTDSSGTPFIVLENSIGTGKTQMAFNLMTRGDVEVFYITLTKDVSNLLVAFFGRSDAFVQCVERDLAEVGDAEVPDILAQPQLYVYGLIWAMLKGATTFRGPRTRQDVMRVMASREGNGRTDVFFLDDFLGLDPLQISSSTRKLRFMLNVFRSFGLVLVVTGASGLIHDLVRLATSSKECDELWCVVFPSLPKFQDPYLESLQDDLRRIISSSRPLFAALVVGYTKINPYLSETSLVAYMDQMVAAVAPKWQKYRRSELFAVGQVRHFLADSYVKMPGIVCRIGGYFARLYETKPFELWLRPPHGLVKGKGGTTVWQCRNVLPLPHEDTLFHLCSSGGKSCGIFVDWTSSPISFRQAVVNATESMLFGARDDAGLMKILVAGAVSVASHRSGYAGSCFSFFFSALLYELNLQNSPDVRVQFPDEVSEILGRLVVPFLAPPNLEWPEFLLGTSLNLGSFFQLGVKDKVDICLLDKKVSIKCVVRNDHPITSEDMKWILGEVPSESVIHIVVTSSLQNRYFKNRKRSRSGDKRFDAFREKLPASWRHAVFYRIGRLSRPVKTNGAGTVWRGDLARVRGMHDEEEESACSDDGSRLRAPKILIFVELSTREELETDKNNRKGMASARAWLMNTT